MKLQKMFLVLLILMPTFQICFGQENPNPELIDEFGKLCSEDVMARYDNFLVHLQNNPSAKGYFVFYGDKSTEGKNLKFIKYLTEFYPTARNFNISRLSLVRGENEDAMKIQFWIVPAGAAPPKPDKVFSENKIMATKQFNKSWADFNKWSGELDIYSDGFLDLGCEFSPNRNAFVKSLLANSNLTGYLVVYTKFGKGSNRGNQVANFALNDLVKNYKVPRNRLKTIYGGNREEPEIEFWFVPKGGKPPISTPDKKQQK